MKIFTVGIIRLLLLFGLSPAASAEMHSLCVFDLLGANGPIYAQMKDYKIAAMTWGVDLQLKPYTSENKAAADFKSGQCDAVSFTGIQSRQFNRFSGSLDAMGALPSYQHLKMLVTAISSEQAAPLMINHPYEVVGIIPIGSAYLFVNDRALVSRYADAAGDLAGIRIAVMDSDPAQIELMGVLGTSSISTSIAEMYQKFNNGLVDVTYGPAVVYQAMELEKGMGEKGGVVRFPLAQLTLQIMIHQARFPEKYADNSRRYALSQFDKAVSYAINHEQRVAPQRWITISDNDKKRYLQIYRKTRVLLAKKGVYDGRMLKLMQRVRCKNQPADAECVKAEE